jgi:hypothetical protein
VVIVGISAKFVCDAWLDLLVLWARAVLSLP